MEIKSNQTTNRKKKDDSSLNNPNPNSNTINNNPNSNKALEKSYSHIQNLPLQMTPAPEKSKEKVNLKFRKYTLNKNNPWKIKEISLDDLPSYFYIVKLLRASLDPKISNSENLKIIFHINKKDKIHASVNSKEDWEANFCLNKKDEFLKAIVSEHNTIKIEYELQDLNKNFNDIASKLDLQNKIIENLFEALKANETIKKEITENLRIKIIENENNPEAKIQQSEIFKSKYAKIMQDYTEKVYEALFNNVRNFQSLQNDLKTINLDQELDFNIFDDFPVAVDIDINNKFEEKGYNQQNKDDLDFFEDCEDICYRSSFNLEKEDEMISKLIIETRNSLYNK